MKYELTFNGMRIKSASRKETLIIWVERQKMVPIEWPELQIMREDGKKYDPFTGQVKREV